MLAKATPACAKTELSELDEPVLFVVLAPNVTVKKMIVVLTMNEQFRSKIKCSKF